MNFVDYTGRRYGKLTVIERGEKNEKRGLYSWVCKCDCGNIKNVIGADLRNKNTISCGCMSSRNFVSELNKTHGLSKTRFYSTWVDMRKRCENPKSKSYCDYGEHGIKVCDKWKTFENFYDDMHATYSDDLTIERVDNSKGYSPENCKWIPKSEQSLNKTDNVNLTLDGETHCAAEMARRYNIPYKTLMFRLKSGWETEKSLKTPVKKQKNNTI